MTPLRGEVWRYYKHILQIKETPDIFIIVLKMCMYILQPLNRLHYSDVIMTTIASQITSLTIVYSIVYSCAEQRKHQGSASLAFVRGIHRWPVNSPHKGPVTRKMFPFDDVITSNTGGLESRQCFYYRWILIITDIMCSEYTTFLNWS